MILLQGTRDRVDFVVLSPDGTTLAAATRAGRLQLWYGPPFGGPPDRHPEIGYCRNPQFTPGGDRLFVAGFRVYDPRLRLAATIPWPGPSYLATYTAPCPAGRRFVMAGSNPPAGGPPSFRVTCRPVDDPNPGAAVWAVDAPGVVKSYPVFLGADRFALVEADAAGGTSSRHRIVVRSVGTGLLDGDVRPLAEDTHVHGLTASPDGRWLATRRASRVLVFDTADLARPAVVHKNDNRKEVTALAFHPSGRYLAVTSNDATVKLYDTASWQLAKTFTWDVGRMRSIAFSPDGTLAAAGSDTGRVVVWDVDL